MVGMKLFSSKYPKGRLIEKYFPLKGIITQIFSNNSILAGADLQSAPRRLQICNLLFLINSSFVFRHKELIGQYCFCLV